MATSNKHAPLSTDDMAVQRRPVRRFDGVNTLNMNEAPDIQIVSVFDNNADYEKFMTDYLEIEIATTQDKNAPPLVPVGVNGVQAWLPRGEAIEVPRYFVERLLRSQSHKFETVNSTDYQAEAGTSIRETIGTDFPFQILYDPDPRGYEWARKIRMQGC